MSVLFHDGDHHLYKGYTGNKAWDDRGLLMINSNTPVNSRLNALNTEETVGGLFEQTDVKTHTLEGYGYSLKSVIEDDGDSYSLIVIKGLHQPFNRARKWAPHITIGFDGYLWHLNFRWDRDDSLSMWDSSRGDAVTGETHDGWGVAGGGRRRGGRRR
jgi:hypothetical protein